MHSWLLVIASPLLASSDPAVETTNSIERVVRFEMRVANVAPGPQDIEIRLPLPRSNERQEVIHLHPEPGYEEILEDRHGNRVARYLEREVEPGGIRARGWIAAARASAAVYRGCDGAGELPSEERTLHTRDASNYKISSSEVQEVRDACVREGMSDEEKAAALFRWLVHNVTYLRDGKWVPAPEVLRTRKGSCSEYNYTLVALLRSCGIPCRATGGLVLTTDNVTRYDGAIHEDRVFHRWTEVWLEGKGWVPADASRGSGAVRRFGNFLDFWGRTPAGLLQTWRGEGGDDGLIGWEYYAQTRAAGPTKSFPVAFWIEAPTDRLEPAIEEVDGILSAGLSGGELVGERLRALVGDRLLREVLFLLDQRIEPAAWIPLARALFAVRHPAAIRYALLAERSGQELPEELRLEALAGDALAAPIRLALEREAGWVKFEDLWRKSRAAIRFETRTQRFELPGSER